MFLLWRLFSSFADALKFLEGGIHFKLIESFLLVERRWCRCSFSLLKLINRRFSRQSHYKNFFRTSFQQVFIILWQLQAFSTRSHAFFFRFFSLQLCQLCHIDRGNFVLPLYSVLQKQPLVVFCKKKVILKISQISQKITCVGVSF